MRLFLVIKNIKVNQRVPHEQFNLIKLSVLATKQFTNQMMPIEKQLIEKAIRNSKTKYHVRITHGKESNYYCVFWLGEGIICIQGDEILLREKLKRNNIPANWGIIEIDTKIIGYLLKTSALRTRAYEIKELFRGCWDNPIMGPAVKIKIRREDKLTVFKICLMVVLTVLTFYW